MSRHPHIGAAASDPGSARALGPVLRRLQAKGVETRTAASRAAVEIFAREFPDLPCQTLDDTIVESEACRILTSWKTDLLLSGAGAYNMLEHRFRMAARNIALPHASILDYWWNYQLRFSRKIDGAEERSFPDLVFVPDASARQGMLEEGFQAHTLFVSGAPNLEDSMQRMDGLNTIAQDLVPGLRGPLVSFFSEPYFLAPDGAASGGDAGFFNAEGHPHFGYTAPEVLSFLLHELGACQQPVTLAVKPHPREHIPILRDIVSRETHPLVNTVILEDADPKEIISASDLVTGMTSITLLESAFSGKPTLSLQPEFHPRHRSDRCIANLLGATTAIRNQAGLRLLLDAFFAPTPTTPAFVSAPVDRTLFEGATERIAEHLIRFCQNRNLVGG
jgi:hypothetical protein